ncbi:MAG: FRG domain-containing protein, partial [Deltaproteobacteria bacterium]|nr:FRG domain-containing protein [Deltaproteobacteria bacterium]
EIIGEPPRGQDVDKSNWGQFALTELIDMVGREDICSVTDAFLKATSLLRVLKETYNSLHPHFLFRGQRDISWDLLPRKGRAFIKSGWNPPSQVLNKHSRTIVLQEEIDSLADFQIKWETLEDVEDIDRNRVLSNNHPEWWFRMQHYDNGDGTRLLDVTTSLTVALLFACVDWSSGKIDDGTDGILYLWVEGMNGNVDDFLLNKMPTTAEKLFSDYPDAPCYILNPPHTERSKAQSGAFLWWPRFWKEAPHGAPYYIRVVASAKKNIVRDLLSMGFGPKEAVRGKKGLLNEQILRSNLGLPGWNPLPLKN